MSIEAREVTLRGVGHWRGGARGAQGDGEQEDGDGQGGGRMTKLKRTHDRLSVAAHDAPGQ